MARRFTMDEERELTAIRSLTKLVEVKAAKLEALEGACPLSDALAGEIKTLAESITIIAASVANYAYEN